MARQLTVNGPDKVMQMDDHTVYRNTIARMFRSGFLEAFTKVHPIVPALMFVPVAAYFGWLGLQALGPLLLLPAIAGGILFWSFTEYVLHRWLFHIEPSNLVSKIIYVYLHGIHHHYPDDHYRLVMVPIISGPLAVAFYFLFAAVLPPAWVAGAFTGMVLGYLSYDYGHWATHHIKIPRSAWAKPVASMLKGQRKRHLRHHFGDHSKGFGVSTGLWDHVFRTVDPSLTTAPPIVGGTAPGVEDEAA